ncbi:MAG: GNAT family N-acetyltransferase [Pseudomonadota bacterium]
MNPTFLIRRATPADLAEIDALLGRSYPALLKGAYPPSLLVTAIPLISKAQPHLLASGTYFVVTDGKELVGAGGWTRAVPGTQDKATQFVGHIRHVVTDHRRVRQGIGRRLMEHILSSARDAGIKTLECYSTLMAVPFYASMGFRTLGDMSVPLRPGIDFPAVHMRCAL